MEDDPPIPGDSSDVGDGDLLSLTQGAEQVGVFGPKQQGILLLVFGTPDLEHGQGVVAEGDLPDLEPGSRWLDDLFQDVAVAAGALVVDADDGIAISELHTGSDDPVDLLLHFGVAALNGVEVELGDVLSLDHAGGRTTAHPDPVGRAADLDHPHPLLGTALLDVPSVDLTDSPREHDRLDPLAAFAVGKAQAEGTRIPLDEGLSELVAVVRGSVAGLDFDLREEGPGSPDRRSRGSPRGGRSRGCGGCRHNRPPFRLRRRIPCRWRGRPGFGRRFRSRPRGKEPRRRGSCGSPR